MRRLKSAIKNQLLSDITSFGPTLQNRLINISLKHRYVWFKIGKAGCTSVATSLHQLELADLPNASAPPHLPAVQSPFVKPYQLPEKMLDDILRGRGYFRFAVVRNPYARLLSAYLDKVAGKAKERKLIEKNLEKKPDDEISFGEFIDAIVDKRIHDPHWMPQVYMVGPKLEAALHLETIADELSKLPKFLEEHLQKTFGVRAPHATGAASRIREYYTPEIIEKVRRYYAGDFSKFGYSPDVLPG
jgi:hypothetical protein